MPKVEEDIQYLIHIVKKDLEIAEKKKLVENVPGRIRAIDRELKKMDDELGETQHVLERIDQEKRHLEIDLKTQQDALKKKQDEQRQVKTNKEFQALITEIGFISKQIDREEERMLAVLDEGEARRREIKALTDRIGAQKHVLVAEKEKLLQETKVTEDSLKILDDEKVRILPHLSPDVRRMYNRILVAKGDSGVANLIGDICYGCYSRVPPQTAVEVRKNDQIINCEVCGRILVYYEVK